MKIIAAVCFMLLFSCVQAQLPTGGLSAYYPFNNNAADESGNKNDGQIYGAVAPAADRFGNPCGAFRFIGTGCYVSAPNSVSLKAPANSLTVTAWVKPEKGNNSSNDLNLILLAKPGIENGTDIKPQYCFQIKRNFGDSYSTISLSSDFSFQDKLYNNHPMEYNQWYFIAITYEENFVQVYQDGKLICQAPKNKPFQPNDFALEIGRDIVAGKRYFNGCLDDLRIYSRGLSFAEINSLFKDETGKAITEEMKVSFPKSIEKHTDNGTCSAIAFFKEPEVTMGCGSVVMKQLTGLPSGSRFGLGRNSLVYEAVVGDKKMVDSFQVTVIDNEPPVFNCITDAVAKAHANTTGVEVDYPGLSVNDNCPNLKLELLEGLPSGAVFPMGVTQVKYQATDAAGNKVQCSFKITVTADAAPVKEEPKTHVNDIKEEERKSPAVVYEPNLLISPVAEAKDPAKETAERERIAREKTAAEKERLDKAKADAKAEAEKYRLEKEKANAENERFAKMLEEKQLLDKVKADALAEAKAAIEREKLEKEKAIAEKERLANVLAEKELLDKAKADALAKAKAQEEQERIAKDAVEKERLENAKADDIAAAKETAAREHIAKIKTRKDVQAPRIACPGDTLILLPPNRKGLIYHYKTPVATDNVGVDSMVMMAGTKDGCFLPLGVHPFIFKAYDAAGNFQVCTYSVIIKEDATLAKFAPPQKLDAALALGNDSVHYEHTATVNDCELTLLIYDDGEQDNDSVTIIFNDEVIVNRDMIRLKENGAFKRTITLIPGEQNYLIAKAWNTGRYGLNTLRIDVYEGGAEGDKKDIKFKKPVNSKILHSRPGNAGGLLLKCN